MMHLLVKFVGIYMLVIGVIILARPKVMHQIIAFFMEGKRIYLAGILRILLGMIFILVASESRLRAVLLTLGILTIIGGVLIFVLKQKKIKTMLNWIEKRSPGFIRLWGALAIGVGVLIIYSM